MSEDVEKRIEGRLTSMEKMLSYMEDFEKKLQDVLVEHSQTIAELQAENRILKAQMKEVYDSMEGDVPNQKPPHY